MCIAFVLGVSSFVLGGNLHTNHEGEVVTPEPGCRPPVAQTRSKTCRNIVRAILKDESEQKESRIKTIFNVT